MKAKNAQEGPAAIAAIRTRKLGFEVGKVLKGDNFILN
jgi:hypothetical protein